MDIRYFVMLLSKFMIFVDPSWAWNILLPYACVFVNIHNLRWSIKDIRYFVMLLQIYLISVDPSRAFSFIYTISVDPCFASFLPVRAILIIVGWGHCTSKCFQIFIFGWGHSTWKSVQMILLRPGHRTHIYWDVGTLHLLWWWGAQGKCIYNMLFRIKNWTLNIGTRKTSPICYI